MGFASLGSGSRGNGTVVALGGRNFLIDCGFSLRQTEQRLARLGLRGGDLDAIFVTHEHADHISGVAALAHKYAIDVYGSYGTLKYDLGGARCHPFDGDVAFQVHGVTVNPVRVPHDAREPTQFVMHDGTETIGVLSDLGCVTSHVVEQYRDCTLLLMEANHDRGMLLNGSYPEPAQAACRRRLRASVQYPGAGISRAYRTAGTGSGAGPCERAEQLSRHPARYLCRAA